MRAKTKSHKAKELCPSAPFTLFLSGSLLSLFSLFFFFSIDAFFLLFVFLHNPFEQVLQMFVSFLDPGSAEKGFEDEKVLKVIKMPTLARKITNFKRHVCTW